MHHFQEINAKYENTKVGCLMFYFSEGIRCKISAKHTVLSNVEIIAIKFHQMKHKWLLLGVYKPPIQSDSEFTKEIIRILNHYIPSYENWMISTWPQKI